MHSYCLTNAELRDKQAAAKLKKGGNKDVTGPISQKVVYPDNVRP
jgi:hypothetical protein